MAFSTGNNFTSEANSILIINNFVFFFFFFFSRCKFSFLFFLPLSVYCLEISKLMYLSMTHLFRGAGNFLDLFNRKRFSSKKLSGIIFWGGGAGETISFPSILPFAIF